LKKERNCGCGGGGTPYPVYPTYPGMMPMNQGMTVPMNQGMGMTMNQNIPMGQMMYNQMGMPNNIMMPTVSGMNTSNDYSTLTNQVNNLERRVSRLESMMNSSSNITPKYSESNYYMV